MKQYEVFEFTFHGEAPQGSQVDIDLTAEFCIDGERTIVPGFYTGPNKNTQSVTAHSQ